MAPAPMATASIFSDNGARMAEMAAAVANPARNSDNKNDSVMYSFVMLYTPEDSSTEADSTNHGCGLPLR